MSSKIRVTIAVLLLFIPVVLGIAHRIYYHGKGSIVFVWKKKKCNASDTYQQNYPTTSQETVKELTVKESELSQIVNKEVKNAPARFIGGNEALQRYIKNEVIYPENQTVQGNVILKMRIDEQGYPTDIVVTKSIGNIFDKEVVRVAKNMPAWEPQIKNYQAVKSDYIYITVPFEKPKANYDNR